MKQVRLLLFILFGATSFAQNIVLDSLVLNANKLATDSLKIDQLHKDFFKYVYSKPEVAMAIADYTISNINLNKQPFQKAQALIRKGIYYDVISKKDSALILYDLAMDIAAPRKDYISMGNVYNDKGLVYWNRDQLEMAMEQYVKGAEVFEKVNYDMGLSSIYNNMGLILYDLKRYAESKISHLKALKIREQLNDTYGLGASYSNLSNVYKRLGVKDSVFYYMKKAIEIKKTSNDQRGLGIAYQNLGIDFREAGVLDSAIYYTKKAQVLYEEIDNKKLSSNSLISLAEMYQLAGKFNLGLESVQKAITLLEEKDLKRLAKAHVVLGRLLAYNGNHKESAHAYARAITFKDQFQETERTAQAQEYYEKYQTAQKEKEISEQKALIAINELKIEKGKRTIYILMAAGLLILFIGIFFYRQQQLKSQQKAKEAALQLALAQIETQNQLQDQRLRISRDLHDNIGSQLTFLISSIDNITYAQKLNSNVASDKLTSLSSFVKNTIQELRDTIWAMNKGDLSLDDIAERTTTIIANFNDAVAATMTLEGQFNHEVNHVFSAVNGMHIFRIIQEALHNAVKFSEATTITVSITTTATHQTIIAINDNGKGFDKQLNKSGNGLKNMQQRASDLQATLTLQTAVDKGTCATLTVLTRR
jgi:signal transduction histidine kinase